MIYTVTLLGAMVGTVVVAAGVLVPPKEYWPMIREICDRYDVLLILDEVIAGCGRTGKMFAHEHWGIYPDILTLAKGISNACVPLGATVMNEKIANFFHERKAFMHGFTYSGHALSCTVGLAAVDAYIEDKVPENAAKVGGYLMDNLKGVQDRHESVGDVRGLGLIESVEFVRDRTTKEPLAAKDPDAPLEERPMVTLSDGCLEEGLLLMPTMAGSMIRISPPLIITEEDVDKAMDIFERQVTQVENRFL
jgi:adenosylmethionine-8-amino-7-oxononanoate aminotransferase